MLGKFEETQSHLVTVSSQMILSGCPRYPSEVKYLQNPSDRLHTAGVGGSNPLPPTKKSKKEGRPLDGLSFFEMGSAASRGPRH
jgi:hypothetical protein